MSCHSPDDGGESKLRGTSIRDENAEGGSNWGDDDFGDEKDRPVLARRSTYSTWRS